MSSARLIASHPASRGRPAAITAGDWLAWAYERILIWVERSRERRHLAMLSDHMLRDIGLTREEVEAEAAKPFWRP